MWGLQNRTLTDIQAIVKLKIYNWYQYKAYYLSFEKILGTLMYLVQKWRYTMSNWAIFRAVWGLQNRTLTDIQAIVKLKIYNWYQYKAYYLSFENILGTLLYLVQKWRYTMSNWAIFRAVWGLQNRSLTVGISLTFRQLWS